MALSLEAASLPSDAVEVGRIQDAWGVKGWIKVHPYCAHDPQAFFATKHWYLQPPSYAAGQQVAYSPSRQSLFCGTQCLRLSQVKKHAEGIVACSDMIADRGDAEALKGARIFIARSIFPPLSRDEFYWVDLIGLHVINREGQTLGVIAELRAAGPQTVLQLEVDGQPSTMIPFVSAYVDAVDTANKTMSVDWQLDYL